MTNVVNLRAARKAKERRARETAAEQNRARFGRTKAERQADAAEQKRKDDLLAGARRDEDQQD